MKWVKRWEVHSMTSDNTYTVALDENGDYGCSCPVWRFRRQQCKHIAVIKEEIKREPKIANHMTRYTVIEI